MTMPIPRPTGNACFVCGSPDGGCGGAHATSPDPAWVGIVDLPEKGTSMTAAEVIVEREVNGVKTRQLATQKEADDNGWTVVAQHKARPAPQPITPTAPAVVEPAQPADLEAMTKADLYELAQQLDIEGRATMTKAELVAALTDAQG